MITFDKYFNSLRKEYCKSFSGNKLLINAKCGPFKFNVDHAQSVLLYNSQFPNFPNVKLSLGENKILKLATKSFDILLSDNENECTIKDGENKLTVNNEGVSLSVSKEFEAKEGDDMIQVNVDFNVKLRESPIIDFFIGMPIGMALFHYQENAYNVAAGINSVWPIEFSLKAACTIAEEVGPFFVILERNSTIFSSLLNRNFMIYSRGYGAILSYELNFISSFLLPDIIDLKCRINFDSSLLETNLDGKIEVMKSSPFSMYAAAENTVTEAGCSLKITNKLEVGASFVSDINSDGFSFTINYDDNISQKRSSLMSIFSRQQK